MKFFETLAATGINDVMIQIKKDNEGLITVFITPKTIAEDAALKSLKPIYVTGTPEEIDKEFFEIITTPLVETQKVFSNIESFEAQKAEALKATADKKKEKPEKSKAKSESEEDVDADSEEETTKPAKEAKVNNEKALKEFMASIKGQDILPHKEQVLQLLENLSEAEAQKPLAKKAKTDLDIAIRKKQNIDDARAKMGLPAKEEIDPVTETKEEIATAASSVPVSEAVAEEPEEEEEEESTFTTKASFASKNKEEVPNVETAGVVEEQPIEDLVAERAIEEQEVVGVIIESQEEELTIKESIPVPTPPEIVYNEVFELRMIATDFTQEQYNAVGWDNDQLVAHGKAEWVKVKVPAIAPTPTSLKYEFPKPFDEEDQDEREE